jgi:putative ABC transport system substrate-binding protein
VIQRRDVLRGLLGAAAIAIIHSGCDHPARSALAEPRVFRVGWLTPAPNDAVSLQWQPWVAFRSRLEELGYVQGTNLTLQYGWSVDVTANPATHAPLQELIASRVDLIVAENWAATRPASSQSTIPVVFIVESDPVEQGLVASLASPGRNLTGLTHDNLDSTGGKRLELLVDAFPMHRSIAVLYDPKHNTRPLAATKTAADVRGVELVGLPVTTQNELRNALAAAATTARAMIIFSGGTTNTERPAILRFAREHRMPTMLDFADWIVDEPSTESGVMSFNPSEVALYRRLADYVDRVLRGVSPRDIPVERPAVYDLIINLRLLASMGLVMSPSVVSQATRIIR